MEAGSKWRRLRQAASAKPLSSGDDISRDQSYVLRWLDSGSAFRRYTKPNENFVPVCTNAGQKPGGSPEGLTPP